MKKKSKKYVIKIYGEFGKLLKIQQQDHNIFSTSNIKFHLFSNSSESTAFDIFLNNHLFKKIFTKGIYFKQP